MNRSRNMNSLLVEIMIAVLFFALCSTVILETFVMARDYSHIAGVETEAMIQLQTLAERLYIEEDPEVLLQQEGYSLCDGVWTKNTLCPQTSHGFALQVQMEERQTAVGTVRESVLRALRGEEIVVEIPSIRYMSREVSE